MTPNYRTVQTNGITLRAWTAGPEDGPLVILVHGWPELAYSWRHQVPALAEAGYRVAALDVRGYGGSDKPNAVETYDLEFITADIAGVIDALGADTTALIGHDWGAPIVWNTALLYPNKVRAVAGLSVVYSPQPEISMQKIFREIYKDRFFYMIYFQDPGIAEAEFEADVRRSLRMIYYSASGDAELGDFAKNKPPTAKFLDGLTAPDPFPTWMSEDDLDIYVDAFEAGGFRGPLNRYRNFDRDWEFLRPHADKKIEQPSLFLAGARDPVRAFVPGHDAYAKADAQLADCRGIELIEGAGHWVQQEAPDQTNAALLGFLNNL